MRHSGHSIVEPLGMVFADFDGFPVTLSPSLVTDGDDTFAPLNVTT